MAKMKFLIFDNTKDRKNFLENPSFKKKENVEYGILNNFNKNRILFTAEHNVTTDIKTPKYGKKSFIRMGDKNTDKLAKIMAHRIKSGFLIPKFSRIDVDACRPIENIGKNEKILVKVYNSNIGMIRYRIHRNKNYVPFLMNYHSIIEKLNPSALISVHGMREKGHPPDILMGFGKNYRIIGGVKKALEFKKYYIKKLNDVFRKFKTKNMLKINISKWLFTGEKNYVLNKHVIQYNKNNKKKRFGMHVEFNMRGRIINKEFIRKDYQIASQVLADTILEWMGKNKDSYN